MDETSDSIRDVELVFSSRGGLEKTKFGVKEFSAKIDEIKNWFKDYKVSRIELWIQGAVKEGHVLKLLVSFEGSGGVKVTLDPR
jgi:hypothetical protein